jgi:hypothetical protein
MTGLTDEEVRKRRSMEVQRRMEKEKAESRSLSPPVGPGTHSRTVSGSIHSGQSRRALQSSTDVASSN